jgi:hypothetical protein
MAILHHSPNSISVGETCSRFYRLVCEIKSYKHIFQFPRGKQAMLNLKADDRAIMIESMKKSSKKVTSLEITGGIDNDKSWRQSRCIDQFKQIIDIHESTIKTLTFKNCPFSFMKTYDNLSGNILKNEFKNQLLVKEIISDGNLIKVKFIDWSKLKLESLEMTKSFATFGDILKGQNKLKSLSVDTRIFTDDFLLICNELKSLESLDIWTQCVSAKDFENISNLTNLKKARLMISRWSVPSIQFIQGFHLIDLDLNCFNVTPQPEAIVQIGSNCPNLKKFKLNANVSFNILNTIIEYFLSLESLDLVFDSRSAYIYQEGLQHGHLKKIIIQSAYSDCQQLPHLLQSCKKLEEFSTTLTLNASFIRDLLRMQPNLNSLSLTTPYTDYTTRKVTRELISVLKEYGSNLKQFQYKMLRFEDKITTQTLKKEFIDQFTEIQFEGADLTGCKEWIMKNASYRI